MRPPDLRLPRDPIHRRRLAALAAALALLAALAGVVAGRGAGGSEGMPSRALALVPARAVLVVHVATDPGRAPVREAAALAARFPGWSRLRDRLVARLAPARAGTTARAWLGDEAVVAVLGAAGTSAGALVLLTVRDEARARAFLAHGAVTRYRGVTLRGCGATAGARLGGVLALGPADAVRAAIDVARGAAPALTADPVFRAAMRGLPGGRVADAYATPDGLRRLLAPAGGIAGAAGALLDRPGLRGVGLALAGAGRTAELTVHSLGSPGVPDTFRPFTPSLLGAVPRGALAFLAVRGFDRAAARIAATGLAGPTGAALARLGRAALAAGAGPGLLVPLRGETVLFLLARRAAPVLVVVARTADPGASRGALDRLVTALPRALRGARVTRTRAAGFPVTVLHGPGGVEVAAAVANGRLVLATDRSGVAAALDHPGSLADGAAFRAVTGTPAVPVTALAFLDFDQLLRLGERTGLSDLRGYRAARGDLSRIGALGLSSSGRQGETTAHLRLLIR